MHIESTVDEHVISERKEVISSLREFADFLEKHIRSETLPFPSSHELRFSFHIWDPSKEGKDLLRKVTRALKPCEKEYVYDWFRVFRCFGKVKVSAEIPRTAVCELVPDPSGETEEFEEVVSRTVEKRTRPKMVWQCKGKIMK